MKYVFIDMDGVIAEYGYPSGLYDGDFQKGNYLGKKPVNAVIGEIITKYNNQDHIVMVCSVTPNAKATLEKNEWLNVYFNVPYENRIFIGKDEDKVEVIRYYIEDIMHGNVQEHCIIIDDNGTNLAKAHSLGIECYHPTQLLAIKKDEESSEEQPAEEPINNTEVMEPEEVVEGEQMTIDDLQQVIEAPSDVEEVKDEE